MEHEKHSTSWLRRHWKWAIPVFVCAPILVCAGIIASVVTAVVGVVKSSDPYVDSLAAVKAHPAVRMQLGSPVEPAFSVYGKVETSGGTGHADITYTVSGPKGSGTVYANADKTGGKWSFTELTLTTHSNRDSINLLAKQEAPVN